MTTESALSLRQRGFTLMETVLVVAVGLGLLIGGSAFYQQARVKSEASEVIRSLVSVTTELRRMGRIRHITTGDEALASPNFSVPIPDGLRLIGRLDWGGLTVRYEKISKAVCHSIAPGNGRHFDKTDLDYGLTYVQCMSSGPLQFVYEEGI